MQKNCLGYPVEIVEDVFGESDVLAKTLRNGTGAERPRVMIVADMNVVQRTEGLGSKIGRYLNAHGIELVGSPVVISGGEKIKTDNLQSAFKVVSGLLEARLGCRDYVLAIGGGTLLDVAGYAASQVRGGVPIVRLPTTPVAMMGAAFGTYAAIDSQSVKDALRVPSVPAAVVIDPTFARTVMDGVWRSGISEALRGAVTVDAKLTKALSEKAAAYRDRDMDLFREIVTSVVSAIQKKGLSPFAEWAAHRLEAMSGYKLPHGYAIAIGVALDSAYAVEKGYLKEKDCQTILGVLKTCGTLDGISHSQHILSQPDSVLLGLDAWSLSQESPAVIVPAGVGKAKVEDAPDRDVYRKVLSGLMTVATEP